MRGFFNPWKNTTEIWHFSGKFFLVAILKRANCNLSMPCIFSTKELVLAIPDVWCNRWMTLSLIGGSDVTTEISRRNPVRCLCMEFCEEWSLQNKSGYTRWTAWLHNWGYRQHKGKSSCTQTSNMPCPHMNCKVHWCWQWKFRKCIVLGNLHQLWHLNNKYQY
jgi:hypothetical protein